MRLHTMSDQGIIACDHCGIVALDTPLFGWKRWEEEDDSTPVLLHHCPAAVQYNGYIATGLVHGKHPDEAVTYAYWPLPDVFYLVNYETRVVTGPFVGRDEAHAELNEMRGEARSGTAVLTDGEYNTYQTQQDSQ